ncbi:MAG: phosphatase PAP2 family protein [Pseudomonadota bacterium]
MTKLYRTFGLLPWLSLLAFLAAIVAHSVSRLPGPYTWLEPLRTFRLVLAEPRFPFALLAVYWLGGWARRGSWDTQGAGRLLGRGDGLSALRAALLPGIARVLVALIADKVLLNSSRDVFDSIALGLLGLSVNAPRLNWKRLSEEAAYTAVCSTIVLVVCYAFTISKALIFMGGREFDAAIVHLESALFGFVPHRVLATWAALHPRFVQMFDWIYFHCFEHMALTTALLVALRRRGQRTEYLAALALCYLIGGLAYHLFPARGPGYFEPKYFEYLNEKSLITNHIRAWLKYNTEGVFNCTVSEIRTWNYIACMPSLHVTHEFIMLYYSRGSRLAFVLSATFTLLTLPAVVVLGWHYPLDVLAGGAVAVAAIAVARWQTRTLLPACFDLGEDETPACPKPVLAPFLRAYRAERRAHTARRD